MNENLPAARETLEVEAVLLDMDGTIVDSTAVVELMWARLADEHGLDLQEILAYSHGRQSQDTYAKFLPPGSDIAAACEEHARTELTLTEGIVEIPGARVLLEALAGLPHAVVTSAPRDLAVQRIVAAGLPVPPELVTAEEVTVGKPDPEGYLLAAKRLGVDPARCLVLEDADAGLQAGIASGATTVVVGEHRSEATETLTRVHDFTSVRARPAAGDGIEVTFGQ
ncbi:HAD-IA family hydrolase [Demequina sp. NBRC 110052]|uniref:HAD-IA family hydrolase n=1 Tax=Demequina sp. NBRC 110052 TaxID=1570341 RepID=UPI000A03C504|nr:HAD-IA family hydrolase [Demequina sp. NBRC 110052]